MKHMNRNIRKAIALLVMTAVFAVFCSAAFAQEIDLDATGSISLTFKDSGTGAAVPGGTVALYKVADIASSEAGLSYEYTQAFSACEAELTNLTSSTLIDLLTAIAAQDSTNAVVQTIGTDGVCRFGDLSTGLYLLVQKTTAEGYVAVSPFLVTLPLSDGDNWVYDVVATPKMGTYSSTTTSTSTTSSTSSTSGTGNVMGDGSGNKLPQTGQLNWPIPVLAVSGILLFFLGWTIVFGGKKEKR